MSYDMASGHRLKLIEMRPDGNGLYEDIEDKSRVVCRPESVDHFTRFTGK